MSIADRPKLVSAELVALPDDGHTYELVNGESPDLLPGFSSQVDAFFPPRAQAEV